jgi:hypothetical protein
MAYVFHFLGRDLLFEFKHHDVDYPAHFGGGNGLLRWCCTIWIGGCKTEGSKKSDEANGPYYQKGTLW